jgi:hypothetical protein
MRGLRRRDVFGDSIAQPEQVDPGEQALAGSEQDGTKTSVWYGGLSPHHPFHASSGQGPRIGPNMFRPSIQAPTPAKPRAAKSSSMPAVPPPVPWTF